jgi:hypothetical protein
MKVRKFKHQGTSSYNVSGEIKIKEPLVSVLFSFSKPKRLAVPVLSNPLKEQAVFME